MTIIGDIAKLTAIKDAIDQRAFSLRKADTTGKTIGELRVEAFFELAMKNVNLHLDIQILTPTTHETGGATESPDGPTTEPDTPAAFLASMLENCATGVHARAGAIDAQSLVNLARFAKKVSIGRFEFDPHTGEPTANTMASDS